MFANRQLYPMRACSTMDDDSGMLSVGASYYSASRRDCQTAATCDALWITETGGALRYAGLRQILERRSRKAGVPPIMPHSLRRLFASLATEDGMNPILLQRILGHSTLETTTRYIKTSAAQLQRAHGEHSPVDKAGL